MVKCSYCKESSDELADVGRFKICKLCYAKAVKSICPVCGNSVKEIDMMNCMCIECAQIKEMELERIAEEEMMGIFDNDGEYHIGEERNITWEDLFASARQENDFSREEFFNEEFKAEE